MLQLPQFDKPIGACEALNLGSEKRMWRPNE